MIFYRQTSNIQKPYIIKENECLLRLILLE